MKIAVLLFGHLRDYNKCAKSLKEHLLDRYDSDVFIHTWDETEPSTFSWHKDRTEKKKIDDIMKEKVLKLYHPKMIEYEHQEKYKDEKVVESSFVRGYKFSTAATFFMFNTMSKANALRKKYEQIYGVKYDFVVVTRPDVELKSFFNIENVIQQAEILGLNLETCRFFATAPISSSYSASMYINQPNDLLFFGKPAVIDKYIKANTEIDVDYIEKHAINVVSIYTSKEIEAGLNPIPISYCMGVDWTFSRARLENKNFSPVKLVLAKTTSFILRPVFRLQRKYEWLDYYKN